MAAHPQPVQRQYPRLTSRAGSDRGAFWVFGHGLLYGPWPAGTSVGQGGGIRNLFKLRHYRKVHNHR
jgi:hypothetical protein